MIITMGIIRNIPMGSISRLFWKRSEAFLVPNRCPRAPERGSEPRSGDFWIYLDKRLDDIQYIILKSVLIN